MMDKGHTTKDIYSPEKKRNDPESLALEKESLAHKKIAGKYLPAIPSHGFNHGLCSDRLSHLLNDRQNYVTLTKKVFCLLSFV
jgi:hypothetical protein